MRYFFKKTPMLQWFIISFFCAFFILGWLLIGPNTIGNDYGAFQVSYSIIYKFYQRMGVEPQWYPHLEGGVPISFFTMGQIFHLPSFLISKFPMYWNGNILYLISLKNFILFIFSALFTFYSINQFLPSWPKVSSFLLSLVFIFQMRSLDALRYGTYWDAMSYGHCMTLSFLLYLINGKKRFLYLSGVCAQLLFSAGYPSVIPFFVLVAIVAVFCSFVYRLKPYSILLKRYVQIFLSVLIGIGAAAPSWMPFLDFIGVNFGRSSGSTLEWANAYPFSGKAQLFANLVAPWLAEVHSAFGGPALGSIVIVWFFIYLIFTVHKNWLLLIALSIPFLFSLGTSGHVFTFFFHYVPGFSFSRIPGRIFAILPTLQCIILLILGTSADFKEQSGMFKLNNLPKKSLLLSSVMIFIFSIISLVQVFKKTETPFADLSPQSINYEVWTVYLKYMWLANSMILCGAIIFSLLWSEKWLHNGLLKKIFIAGLFFTTLMQGRLIFEHGTWITKKSVSDKNYEALLKADHLPLYGTYPLIVVNEILPSYWGAETKKMVEFVKNTGEQTSKVIPFLLNGKKDEAFLPFYLTKNYICLSEGQCKIETKRDLSIFDRKNLVKMNQENKIISLTPNLIELKIDPSERGLLVTPFPNVPNWNVHINGSEAKFIELNSGILAVPVEKGKQVVKIFYFSNTYIFGLLLFWLSFVATLIFLIEGFFLKYAASFLFFKRPARIISYIFLFYCVASWIHFVQIDSYMESVLKRECFNNSYHLVLEKQIRAWKGQME